MSRAVARHRAAGAPPTGGAGQGRDAGTALLGCHPGAPFGRPGGGGAGHGRCPLPGRAPPFGGIACGGREGIGSLLSGLLVAGTQHSAIAHRRTVERPCRGKVGPPRRLRCASRGWSPESVLRAWDGNGGGMGPLPPPPRGPRPKVSLQRQGRCQEAPPRGAGPSGPPSHRRRPSPSGRRCSLSKLLGFDASPCTPRQHGLHTWEPMPRDQCHGEVRRWQSDGALFARIPGLRLRVSKCGCRPVKQ